jgi:hypothetical protein
VSHLRRSGTFFANSLPALTDRPNLCRPCGAGAWLRGIIREYVFTPRVAPPALAFPQLTFSRTLRSGLPYAAPSGLVRWRLRGLRRRFALLGSFVVALRAWSFGGVGGFGTAVAEPPHSVIGWAGWSSGALRETDLAWATRASHWVMRLGVFAEC